MEDEWKQTRIIHCPNHKCKGMLLSNKYKHELKCSDCGDLFLEKIEFVKVRKSEIQEDKVLNRL